MNQLNIIRTVKQSVGLRQAALFYGLRFRQDGKALCPFHQDRHPSMQLYDDHYYCFSCEAHGDVVDLVAGLFHLTPAEAAQKLCEDFGINWGDSVSDSGESATSSANRNLGSDESFRDSFLLQREQTYLAFCKYRHLLLSWRDILSPHPGEEPSEGFCTCCHDLFMIEQYLDILQPGSAYPEEDMKTLIKEKEKEVEIIHGIISSIS